MPSLLLKKVCYTCVQWTRHPEKIFVWRECKLHKERVPLYGYCPHWEGYSRILKTPIIKEHQLEK